MACIEGSFALLCAERDRALAERDAAVEELVFQREQLAGFRAYHAALRDNAMQAARVEAQLERGEQAIVNEELAYRTLHWAEPELAEHAVRA